MFTSILNGWNTVVDNNDERTGTLDLRPVKGLSLARLGPCFLRSEVQPMNPLRTVAALAVLGIFGASLFFGDSMITPAISVLSAVEGVKVVDPSLERLVVPAAAAIIVVPEPMNGS